MSEFSESLRSKFPKSYNRFKYWYFRRQKEGDFVVPFFAEFELACYPIQMGVFMLFFKEEFSDGDQMDALEVYFKENPSKKIVIHEILENNFKILEGKL